MLREAKAKTWRRVLIARSCASVGGKDVLGEVKGGDLMGVRVADRRGRHRGKRGKEVQVHPKRRSLGHKVSNLVLEIIEESCAFGEEIVLVGLR